MPQFQDCNSRSSGPVVQGNFNKFCSTLNLKVNKFHILTRDFKQQFPVIFIHIIVSFHLKKIKSKKLTLLGCKIDKQMVDRCYILFLISDIQLPHVYHQPIKSGHGQEYGDMTIWMYANTTNLELHHNINFYKLIISHYLIDHNPHFIFQYQCVLQN